MQGGQQGGGQGNFGHEEDHGGKGERIWEASAQGFGRGSAAPGAAGFVEDLGDGLENLWAFSGMRLMASPSTRMSEGCPPDFMVRLGWAESGGAPEGGWEVSGLGGVGYGEGKIFYVGVMGI